MTTSPRLPPRSALNTWFDRTIVRTDRSESSERYVYIFFLVGFLTPPTIPCSLCCRDWRGFSYAHLLPASAGAPGGDSSVGSTAGGATSAILGGGGGGGGGVESEGESTIGGGSVSGGGGIGDGGDGAGSEKIPYQAGFLDDPALKVGRHRHMTKGDRNTGPVASMVVCSSSFFFFPPFFFWTPVFWPSVHLLDTPVRVKATQEEDNTAVCFFAFLQRCLP